ATADGDFSNSTDMFFGNLAPGGYAWIIPKAHCANVGLGTWQYFHGNLQSLFDRFVRSRDLEPGKATGGFVPVMGPPPRTVKDNAMLVGDAAGMVMATNGGGNNVAMIAGRIAGLTAADHLLDGTPLDEYETRWRAAVGGPLAQGVRIKKLADRFFGSDWLLEAAMFISHAHLDHTGMIPWVTRRQDVDVVLTPPTADVADLLLQDSLKIADAEGFDAPFDDSDLRTARRRFRTIDFGDNVDVGDLEVTAHPAGHIPGATMFEVNGAETSLFTGDLHTLTTDLVWGAKPVACDNLFIESTYAGRQHPERLKS